MSGGTPGEYFRDELDARGWTTAEFAAFIATRFGQDAETWLKIDQQYHDAMRTTGN